MHNSTTCSFTFGWIEVKLFRPLWPKWFKSYNPSLSLSSRLIRLNRPFRPIGNRFSLASIIPSPPMFILFSNRHEASITWFETIFRPIGKDAFGIYIRIVEGIQIRRTVCMDLIAGNERGNHVVNPFTGDFPFVIRSRPVFVGPLNWPTKLN